LDMNNDTNFTSKVWFRIISPLLIMRSNLIKDRDSQKDDRNNTRKYIVKQDKNNVDKLIYQATHSKQEYQKMIENKYNEMVNKQWEEWIKHGTEKPDGKDNKAWKIYLLNNIIKKAKSLDIGNDDFINQLTMASKLKRQTVKILLDPDDEIFNQTLYNILLDTFETMTFTKPIKNDPIPVMKRRNSF